MIAYTLYFTKLYQFPFQRTVLQSSGNSQLSKNVIHVKGLIINVQKNQSNYTLYLWIMDFDLSSNIQTYWLQTSNLLHHICFERGVAVASKTSLNYNAQESQFFLSRIQFNSEEQWTKALKYMLTNLKWGLAWVSSQFANKWQLGAVTSIFHYLLNAVKNSHLIMIKNCDTLCICHVLIKEMNLLLFYCFNDCTFIIIEKNEYINPVI